ncbi:hypothetical protein Tco_0033706 [Tanacetum coccineum]
MAHMEFCDKHNMVAFLQKPTGSEEFHQIVDFLAGSHIRYALTTNPTIYVSLVEQFWQTATVETDNDGEQQITVTVDGHNFAITQASIRRHLQLAYADGVHVPLFDTMLIHDQPGQGEGPTLFVESQHTTTISSPTSLPTTSQLISSLEHPSHDPTTEPITTTSSPQATQIPQTQTSMPYDSPLSRVDKVTTLEIELTQTKKVYGKAITKLVKMVKHLEDKLKSTTVKRKARMVISDKEEDLVSKSPSKQGRMKETEYQHEEEEYPEVDQETFEAELSVLSAAKILAEASRERVKTYKRKRRSTDSSIVSTAEGLFSIAKDIQVTDEEIAQTLNEEEKAKAAAKEE